MDRGRVLPALHHRAFWRARQHHMPITAWAPRRWSARCRHASGRRSAPGWRWSVRLPTWSHPRPGAAGGRDQVQILERPQIGRGRNRAQVDVEALAALAGEHLHPRERVTAGLAEACRSWAWTAVRCCRAGSAALGAQHRRHALATLATFVDLAPIPVRACRSPRSGRCCRGTCSGSRTSVWNVNWQTIRPRRRRCCRCGSRRARRRRTGRSSVRRPEPERHIVADEGHGVRLVGTDEGIGVGAVGHGILRDPGGLAM